MAAVYLCEDERLGRRVAVKRLHADIPAAMERRFSREARVGASLNHPNLVAVYDTATDDEGVLIVMELVDGVSLADELRRDGPLDGTRVAAIAVDIGRALDHVHAQGVVHRDVKPGNVLLRKDGVAKLADLGIATAADHTRLTRSGDIIGTASYMAPEQLDGRDAGPAADVYALAAVCFEALSGEKARKGRNPMEIAQAVASSPPPDLRDHLPGAAPAAAEALRRGLALHAADRQRSASAFAAELTRGLDSAEPRPEPAPEPATEALPRVAPPARPRSRGAFVAAAAALLLAGVGVAGAVLVSSGGQKDGGPGARAGSTATTKAAEPAETTGVAERTEQTIDPSKTTDPSETTAPAPAAEPEPAAPEPGPLSGPELNAQGFELMQNGRYAEAVPVLRQAVAAWPADSRELEYAFTLFNLGKSLNETGRSAEAVPYLLRRLTWDNQRATVQAELAEAQRRVRED